MHLPVPLLVLFAACTPGHDAAEDGPARAGRDLSERPIKELSSSYTVFDGFHGALGTLGLEVADLTWPDAGATFDVIPTRLHWTDDLRHQGDLAPVFGHMVGEDAAAALEADPGEVVRELLVAQSSYLDRDAYLGIRYDEAFTADPDAPLLEAVRAFYEHAPVDGAPEPPTAPWSEIEAGVAAQVEAFSLPTQEALALAIAGLLRAAELRDEALLSGAYRMEDWDALHASFWGAETSFLTYTHDFGTWAFPEYDRVAMARAGQLAVRSLETARLRLQDAGSEDAALDLVGPLGRLRVDLSSNAVTYDPDTYFLLVDGGGDDTYLDWIAVNQTIHQPVAAVLDLDGDDTWQNDSHWTIEDASITISDSRMQGAGLFGVAVLDDAAGNDRYHASAVAQGVGVFGVGVLVDHGGDDTYQGYWAAQGHGQFGYGLLADLGGGADRYETLEMSQGYGGPVGVGWAVDDAGDDAWLAIADPLVFDWAGEGSNWSGSQGFGYGVRDGYFTEGAPIFSGGLGALVDLDGDDDFQCAVMCQGFGYAFGTGVFYDAAGNDDHLTTHKYSLGSATHWAVGVYVDLGGDDTYVNDDDDECIGEGYDGSVAWHLDRGQGADTYTLVNQGEFVLGVSRIPALGVFVNEGGDDAYEVPGEGAWALGRTFTDAGNRDGTYAEVTSLGMFFDLGGTDAYGTARTDVSNGATWVQSEPQGADWDPRYDFGYGMDAP